ncbi:mycofactocin biosynthesis peptidyl-dipeptidase MftE [Microbacter sp. GSS18]|nr:mycofactocin biosynthesis peptidyl-dipeptidase MftE [Microbacter sp. GSS18]
MGETAPGALGGRTWPSAGRPVLLVPVGSLEQHGPHLPLDTDTVIAVAVAEDLAERMRAAGDDAVVAPAIAIGASGEHQGFAGTLSIGSAALETVVLELCRSATLWLDRIVFVNGHGGNVAALSAAVPLARSEARDAAWLPCAPAGPVPAGDAHAGFVETAIMLHLHPGRVRNDLVEPGATAPLAELMPAMRAGGVVAVSPNGILGDPTGATAADGERLLRGMCDRAWALLRDGVVGSGGRLVAVSAD